MKYFDWTYFRAICFLIKSHQWSRLGKRENKPINLSHTTKQNKALKLPSRRFIIITKKKILIVSHADFIPIMCCCLRISSLSTSKLSGASSHFIELFDLLKFLLRTSVLFFFFNHALLVWTLACSYQATNEKWIKSNDFLNLRPPFTSPLLIISSILNNEIKVLGLWNN